MHEQAPGRLRAGRRQRGQQLRVLRRHLGQHHLPALASQRRAVRRHGRRLRRREPGRGRLRQRPDGPVSDGLPVDRRRQVRHRRPRRQRALLRRLRQRRPGLRSAAARHGASERHGGRLWWAVGESFFFFFIVAAFSRFFFRPPFSSPRPPYYCSFSIFVIENKINLPSTSTTASGATPTAPTRSARRRSPWPSSASPTRASPATTATATTTSCTSASPAPAPCPTTPSGALRAARSSRTASAAWVTRSLPVCRLD